MKEVWKSLAKLLNELAELVKVIRQQTEKDDK